MFNSIYNRVEGIAAKLRFKAVDTIWLRHIFDSIGRDAVILEIGGGYNPRFTKKEYPNVFHLDHTSAEELRVKYAADPNTTHLVDQIQPVDFIADGRPIEELVPSELRFDVIFSSHALEHQVDLIGHFISLEKLLKSGGRVILVIPDYRYCFDALRFPTVVSDAIIVHRRGGRVHKEKQIFEHLSRTINLNIGRKLRAADFAVAKFSNPLQNAFDAMLKSEQPDAAYEDAHAWVFSPVSFRLLLLELYMLGYTRLRPSQISPTYGNQFCAVLELDNRFSGPPTEIIDELENERLALSAKLRH